MAEGERGGGARAGPDPASGQAPAAARSGDRFGADLHLLLSAGGGNVVSSPASVAAGLHLALLGARGATADELAAALHLPGAGAAGQSLRLLSAGLADVPGSGVTLRAPTTLWVQSGLPLLPAFTGAAGAMGGTAVRDADFAHAARDARDRINAVIAEQTGGRVTGLLAPGSVGALTRLVLTAAVYLHAVWAAPFPREATADAPFRLEQGGEVPVAMMRLEAGLAYRRGDGYQAVMLPYLGGRLAMAVILPDGPLPPLEARLPDGGVNGLVAGASQARVRLRMPKFRQSAAFGLVPVLRRLGVRHAFTGEADFSGITTAAGLAIGEVVHQAFIDVDEQGTEAAAATATVMRAIALVRPTRPDVEMTVDHPFLFAVTDTATGLPLFLGRVTAPSGGTGAALGH